MTRPKDIYELFSIWSPHKRISYTINGIIMGLGAPLGWLFIDVLFFRPKEYSILAFLVREVARSPQQILLFLYMTLGTSLVMSVTGYLVGRGFDWNEEKADQLTRAHSDIEEQKEIFEVRFHRLRSEMSNLYQTGTDIQKSSETDQVLHLIADGAHRVLNFDRVNIFLLDKDKQSLFCREARGHSGRVRAEIRVPLSAAGGVLTRTIQENEVYLIKDMKQMPTDFRLGQPFDGMPELRSRSFACIPLRERGEPIGLIAVDNKVNKVPIQDENLSTLKILADQGSIALTNISLFRGIKDLHRELERNFEELLDQKERFSSIVSDLSDRAAEISAAIQQVARNAKGLAETVNDASSSVHQMSGSLQEVALGVKSLFEEAEKTVSSNAEMSASIREVECRARESNSLSAEVKNQAEGGAALVQESIQGIQKIQDIVLKSVDVIDRLGRKTGAIGEVLEVINNINEKTNVLALNAAIISAQAGEHGKGFAVVSSEIRALSEQTAISAKEIEKMIESVQDEVHEAVATIQSIPGIVNNGVQLSRRSGEGLNQILRSAVTSLEMTEKIEQATREQVRSAELVSRALDKVNEMIQKMTRSIDEQSQGSRVIARANEDMRKMTEQVASAAVHQSDGFQNVSQMICRVSGMVQTLFVEAEKRKRESELIIQGVDVLERRKPSA